MIPLSSLNCNLIFLSGSLEEEWFIHCLSELNPKIVRAYSQTWEDVLCLPEQNSYDIYYTNPTNKHGCNALRVIRSSRSPQFGHGLLLGADENYLAHPSLHYGALFVIRTYFCAFNRHPRILAIPEGPFYKAQSINANPRPHHHFSDTHPISVFFSGQIKYSRLSMVKAFKGIANSYIVDSLSHKLEILEYTSRLQSARFALCPNGNTTPDTLRLYEALEMEVVPLCERTIFFDYLGALFSECPIPRFTSWTAARQFIETIDDDSYSNLKDLIVQWWTNYKLVLPGTVKSFVHGALLSESNRFPLYSSLDYVIYRIRGLVYLLSLASFQTILIRFVAVARSPYRKLASMLSSR